MQSAKAWLEKAHEDHKTAQLLQDKQLDSMCFHLQQTWEKAFKAVNIAEGNGLEHTHDIRRLAKDVEHPQTWKQYFDTLTRFYTASRYPNNNTLIDHETAHAILNKTNEVLQWAKTTIEQQ